MDGLIPTNIWTTQIGINILWKEEGEGKTERLTYGADQIAAFAQLRFPLLKMILACVKRKDGRKEKVGQRATTFAL